MIPSAKGAIIYSSRYGATRQYAQWLSEELKWPMLEADHTTSKDLSQYDQLIIGSSVYLGKLLVKDWVRMHNPVLGDKEIMFFIVCGTPACDKELQENIARTNIPHDLICTHNVFFLPGRLTIGHLTWKDKVMLRLGARLQKDPVKKQRMLTDVDNVAKEHLLPILQQATAHVEVL